MASTSDIRKGLCIKYNNDIYKIIEFLHVKPGKGPAFVRTKLRSVTSGKVLDNTNNISQAIPIIEAEIKATKERDDILQFVLNSKRGLMKGYN